MRAHSPGYDRRGDAAKLYRSRAYAILPTIDAALAAAVQAGGEIAHPPMEIPGHGTFAIYLQGGNDHGLWQL